MTISAVEKLNRFYEQFALDDDVLIPLNADPDSIASAMAVKRLLWRRVSSVTLTHINVIKRPDNLAMIRLLRVPLIHTDDIQLEGFNCCVMVDSQPDHHEFFLKITPKVIIDHHPDTHADAPFFRHPPEVRRHRIHFNRIYQSCQNQTNHQAGHRIVSRHQNRYQ